MVAPAKDETIPRKVFQWVMKSKDPQDGFYESEAAVKTEHQSQSWWKVICLLSPMKFLEKVEPDEELRSMCHVGG